MHQCMGLLRDLAHLTIVALCHPYHSGQVGLDLLESVPLDVGFERKGDIVDVRLEQMIVELELGGRMRGAKEGRLRWAREEGCGA